MSERLIFLAQNLVFLRKESQMTQADLAGKLGVKPNTISNYENGNSMPDLDTVQKLTEVFHIPADLLLYTKLTPEVLIMLHDLRVQVVRQSIEEGHPISDVALRSLGGTLTGGMVAAVIGGAGLVPGVLGLTGGAMLGKAIWKAHLKSGEATKRFDPEKTLLGEEQINKMIGNGTSYYKTCESEPAWTEAAECTRLKEELCRKDEIIMNLSNTISKLVGIIGAPKDDAE